MINKAWTVNLVLFLLVVVLGLIAWLEPGGAKKAEENKIPLSHLKAEGISIIRIENEAADTVVMEKKNGLWYLLEPFQLPANQIKIDIIAEFLGSESQDRFEAKNLPLTEFGLQPPKLVLTVDSDSFAFGGSTPLDYRRYVLNNGVVHLTRDSYYSRISVPPVAYASLYPLGEKPQLEEIHLSGRHLLRQDEKWSLQPEDPAVSADEISTLAEAWGNAQAFNVEVYNAQQAKEQGEKVAVKLSGKEDWVEFLISAREPELVLINAAAGVQYQFTAKHGKRLLYLDKNVEP